MDGEEETLLVTFMYDVAKEAIQTFPLKVRCTHGVGGRCQGAKQVCLQGHGRRSVNAFSLGRGGLGHRQERAGGVGRAEWHAVVLAKGQ